MIKPVTAASYIRKADRALATARRSLAESDTEDACNRAYYAMFHAAHAALWMVGLQETGTVIKKSWGIYSLLGQEPVKTGVLDAAHGRRTRRTRRRRACSPTTPPMLQMRPMPRRPFHKPRLLSRHQGEILAMSVIALTELVLGMLGVAAKLERRRIKERTERGRTDAKAKGVKFGRKLKLALHQQREAIRRQDKDGETLLHGPPPII